jgi:hypothetical protein
VGPDPPTWIASSLQADLSLRERYTSDAATLEFTGENT